MTKYREDALIPMDLEYVEFYGADAWANIVTILLLASSAHKQTSEGYHLWIMAWKDCYQALSKDINAEKKANAYSNVRFLRRLANTFLNARQYAKDKRRSMRVSADD